MAPRDIRTYCRVSDGADALLRTAITRLALSARAYHRVLKIPRTIADLEGAADLQPKHVSEAIQYRSLDRRGLAEPFAFPSAPLSGRVFTLSRRGPLKDCPNLPGIQHA